MIRRSARPCGPRECRGTGQPPPDTGWPRLFRASTREWSSSPPRDATALEPAPSAYAWTFGDRSGPPRPPSPSTRDLAPRSRAAMVHADVGRRGAALLAQFERERPQIGGFGTDGPCQALDVIDRLLRTGRGAACLAWWSFRCVDWAPRRAVVQAVRERFPAVGSERSWTWSPRSASDGKWVTQGHDDVAAECPRCAA